MVPRISRRKGIPLKFIKNHTGGSYRYCLSFESILLVARFSSRSMVFLFSCRSVRHLRPSIAKAELQPQPRSLPAVCLLLLQLSTVSTPSSLPSSPSSSSSSLVNTFHLNGPACLPHPPLGSSPPITSWFKQERLSSRGCPADRD